MTRVFALTSAALVLSAILTGCGQKGPLVLPQPEQPATNQAASN